MTARYIVGDVLEVLETLPDGSIDLVFTSPPFLALRSYLPANHPDKAKEIGRESTPGEFIDALLDVVEACTPKLAPHGSLCFELGDTYAGSGGHGGDYAEGGWREGQEKFAGAAAQSRQKPRSPRPKYANAAGRDREADESEGITQSRSHSRKPLEGWPLDKSLCLIPEIFRFSLVYGFNPLTGRETDRWRARNVVRWCRPNPPVGALGDKVRPATSDILVVCKDRVRYFDLDAVRAGPSGRTSEQTTANDKGGVRGPMQSPQNPGGAPPLDHWWEDEDSFDQDAWLISTAPYKGSHYATFPTELVIKPLLLMCPEKVCLTCGEPSRRLVDAQRFSRHDGRLLAPGELRGHQGDNGGSEWAIGERQPATAYTTLGWSHCGCGAGCRPTTWKVELTEVEQGRDPQGKWVDLDEWEADEEPTKTRTKKKRKRVLDDLGQCADESHWRRGVVLDPFAGSGTTLAVASGHGRDSVGIDLDERNANLALDRIGMFLTVQWPEAVSGCA